MDYFEGNTIVSAQNGNIYSLHNNINVCRAWSCVRYYGKLHERWINIHWMFSTSK